MGKIRNNKVIRKYGKSLQFRIFIIFILVGLIPIWVMKYGILNSYESQAVRQRGEMVHSQCAVIAEQLGKSGYLTGTASEAVEVEIKQLADLYNGRIVLVNQDFRIVRDTYGLDEQKMIVSEDVLKCFKGEDTYETVKQDSYIEMTAAVYDPEGENILGQPGKIGRESHDSSDHSGAFDSGSGVLGIQDSDKAFRQSDPVLR